MSGEATTQERIMRALANGPLYEGVIPLVVSATPQVTRRCLRSLANARHIVNENGTWRLT